MSFNPISFCQNVVVASTILGLGLSLGCTKSGRPRYLHETSPLKPVEKTVQSTDFEEGPIANDLKKLRHFRGEVEKNGPTDGRSLYDLAKLFFSQSLLNAADWATSEEFKRTLELINARVVRLNHDNSGDAIFAIYKQALLRDCGDQVRDCLALGRLSQNDKTGGIIVRLASRSESLQEYYGLLEMALDIESRGGTEGLKAAYLYRAEGYAKELESRGDQLRLRRHGALVERLSLRSTGDKWASSRLANPWTFANSEGKTSMTATWNRLREELIRNPIETLSQLSHLQQSELENAGSVVREHLTLLTSKPHLFKDLMHIKDSARGLEFFLVDRLWGGQISVAQAKELLRLGGGSSSKIIGVARAYLQFEFARAVYASHRALARSLPQFFEVESFLNGVRANASSVRLIWREVLHSGGNLRGLLSALDTVDAKVEEEKRQALRAIDHLPNNILVHSEYPHMIAIGHFMVTHDISYKRLAGWIDLKISPSETLRSIMNGDFSPWFGYASIDGTGAHKGQALNRFEVIKAFSSALDFDLFQTLGLEPVELIRRLLIAQLKIYFSEREGAGAIRGTGLLHLRDRLASIQSESWTYRQFMRVCSDFSSGQWASVETSMLLLKQSPFDSSMLIDVREDLTASSIGFAPYGYFFDRHLELIRSGAEPALEWARLLYKVFARDLERRSNISESQRAEMLKTVTEPIRELEELVARLNKGIKAYFLNWSDCYIRLLQAKKQIYFETVRDVAQWGEKLHEILQRQGPKALLGEFIRATSAQGYASKATIEGQKLLVRPYDLAVLAGHFIQRRHPTMRYFVPDEMILPSAMEAAENAAIVLRVDREQTEFVQSLLVALFGVNGDERGRQEQRLLEGSLHWSRSFDDLIYRMNWIFPTLTALYAATTDSLQARQFIDLHLRLVDLVNLTEEDVALLSLTGRRAMGNTSAAMAYDGGRKEPQIAVDRFKRVFYDEALENPVGLIDHAARQLSQSVLADYDVLQTGPDSFSRSDKNIPGHISALVPTGKHFATYRKSDPIDIFGGGESIDREFESYYRRGIAKWRSVTGALVSEAGRFPMQTYRLKVNEAAAGPVFSRMGRDRLEKYWSDFDRLTEGYYTVPKSSSQ